MSTRKSKIKKMRKKTESRPNPSVVFSCGIFKLIWSDILPPDASFPTLKTCSDIILIKFFFFYTQISTFLGCIHIYNHGRPDLKHSIIYLFTLRILRYASRYFLAQYIQRNNDGPV